MHESKDRHVPTRRVIFIPANRVGCLLVPLLAFSISVGVYAAMEGIEGIWIGEMTVRTRRGGRILLTDGPARLVGAGFLVTSPALAALPLGLVLRPAISRWFLFGLFGGVLLVAFGLIWWLLR